MQTGFLDIDDRLDLLEELGEPSSRLRRRADWEQFRALLSQVNEKRRKSSVGRKRQDVVWMSEVLTLQHLYDLSDAQIEYQRRDRYLFCCLLELTPEGHTPDARTAWSFRERLMEHGMIKALFDSPMELIRTEGYIACKGQVVDASFVSVPRQRKSRSENEAIKQDETPEYWYSSEAMRQQKDAYVWWTKKNTENQDAYKNRVSVNDQQKLISHYHVTTASVHDSLVFDELLDPRNTSAYVCAGSARRSMQRERVVGGKQLPPPNPYQRNAYQATVEARWSVQTRPDPRCVAVWNLCSH